MSFGCGSFAMRIFCPAWISTVVTVLDGLPAGERRLGAAPACAAMCAERGVHRRHTLAAAESFGTFDRPVLLAWGADDRLFPMSLAERLAALLPDARVIPVAGARTFIPEDQPEILAKLVTEFAG